MSGFTYKLEHADGTPADPPTFQTAVPNWQDGATIPLGRERTLRVIETRPAPGSDEDPLLVVDLFRRYRAEACRLLAIVRRYADRDEVGLQDSRSHRRIHGPAKGRAQT
jgi:hypothetical protein